MSVKVRRFTVNGHEISSLSPNECEALVVQLQAVARTKGQRTWGEKMRAHLDGLDARGAEKYFTIRQEEATRDTLAAALYLPRPNRDVPVAATPEPATTPPQPISIETVRRRDYTFWTGRNGFRFIRENKIKSFSSLSSISSGLHKNFKKRIATDVEFAVRLMKLLEENGGNPSKSPLFKEAAEIRDRRAGRVPAPTNPTDTGSIAVIANVVKGPVRWYERVLVRLGFIAAGAGALAFLLQHTGG